MGIRFDDDNNRSGDHNKSLNRAERRRSHQVADDIILASFESGMEQQTGQFLGNQKIEEAI